MIYLVFPQPLDEFSHLQSYVGDNREDALAYFRSSDLESAVFHIDSKVRNIYFLGFDQALLTNITTDNVLTLFNAAIDSYSTATSQEDKDYYSETARGYFEQIVETAMVSIDSAKCAYWLHNYIPLCSKTTQTSLTCDACRKTGVPLFKTAYSDHICAECWDDYIHTERGFVEYVIGISENRYKPTDFTETETSHIIRAWNANVQDLKFYSNTEPNKNYINAIVSLCHANGFGNGTGLLELKGL